MSSTRRGFIALLLSVCVASLLYGCARGTEDPRETKRFTAFLTSVLAGHVRTTDLDTAMRSALTPANVEAIREHYLPRGTFSKLEYVQQDQLPGFRRYFYAAIFSNGKEGVMFVVHKGGIENDKIAGFFNV